MLLAAIILETCRLFSPHVGRSNARNARLNFMCRLLSIMPPPPPLPSPPARPALFLLKSHPLVRRRLERPTLPLPSIPHSQSSSIQSIDGARDIRSADDPSSKSSRIPTVWEPPLPPPQAVSSSILLMLCLMELSTLLAPADDTRRCPNAPGGWGGIVPGWFNRPCTTSPPPGADWRRCWRCPTRAARLWYRAEKRGGVAGAIQNLGIDCCLKLHLNSESSGGTGG